MKSRLATLGFVLLATALLLAACEQRAPRPTATLTPAPTRAIEGEWPIPKAIKIAVKDPSVQEEISGQGYEVGEVRQLDLSEPGVFLVAIHVGQRELPGITLAVVVDVVQENVLSISPQLRPKELTEEEKAEARRIALFDPEVLKRIGDKEYEVTHIEEFSWSEGDEFFVFPAVELNIPPDRRVEGMVLRVAVDLEAKRVVEIISTPRKSLPPDRPK